MDKYTVDLDKVLNDFEYSELTDQYVKPSSHNNNNNNNRVKNGGGSTKHSINNVFHSLNEYLNTDVSDKCTVVGEFVTDNNFLGKEEEQEEEEEEEAAQLVVVNDSETINCVNNEVSSQPVINLLNDNANEQVNHANDSETNDDETTEPLQSILEDCHNLKNERVEIVETQVKVITESLESQSERVKEEQDDLKETENIEVSNLVNLEIEKETSDQVVFEETKECETVEEQPLPFVAFSEPVELEEAELTKYLDDLEVEFEEDVKHNATTDDNQIETIEETVASHEISEENASDDKNNVSRPDSLPLDTTEQKKDINLIGDPGSTPYNNMYLTKPLPPTVDDTATTTKNKSETEESSSPSPTFSDVSTGSTTPSTETLNDEEIQPQTEATAIATTSTSQQNNTSWLGKQAPLWIPDSEATNCMHCDMKFTVIKRRHHCRACGLVLCSKCCYLKHRLDYLETEARVCNKCYEVLSGVEGGDSPQRQPNPNNPMEYCSMVPPLQQVSSGGAVNQTPPTVMVPVGVLKRTGSNKKSNKSVMFCDGIRPGSDLTNLDNDFNYNSGKKKAALQQLKVINRNVPVVDVVTGSFIPADESSLPPTVTFYKSDISYSECGNNSNVVEMLKNEILTFALQKNLFVQVNIINMDCCINKQAWCFSTDGLINVGQDEVVILLEFIDGEKTVPKDIFYHINNIYSDAVKGVTVKELGISLHNQSIFLDSKNHAGFLYIRPTFQCLTKVIIPKEQYLIGILIHRWETPWAKIFPLRLILRLGAEYRYYPSPIISTRHRESVFVEIGHTIIKLLADFRNYSYTLQQIRGLTIHMEDKNTTVNIPVNRYDQVMKAINNSSDHILAFGACFSPNADSHLVCIQDVHASGENSSYNTHAINIQNKPRKVTGASFIVFNGALKTSSGLTAKSSIVEDGLMIQIPAEQMEKIRDNLKNMKNHTIQCGCVNAESDETVNIIWSTPDTNFNVGVESVIDKQPLSSVPSIRVHSGKDYTCNSGNHLIRWTEVFIIQNCEENSRNQDAVNISKISESIAKAVSQALVKYLDLLSSNNFHKIGIRVTLHVDNVSYCAGSNNMKLPPIYMKSLDNELVPVLHKITSNSLGESAIVLELIFRILNV